MDAALHRRAQRVLHRAAMSLAVAREERAARPAAARERIDAHRTVRVELQGVKRGHAKGPETFRYAIFISYSNMTLWATRRISGTASSRKSCPRSGAASS